MSPFLLFCGKAENYTYDDTFDRLTSYSRGTDYMETCGTTKEWYHVHVNSEEIICTGGHPFYVLNAAADRQKVNY